MSLGYVTQRLIVFVLVIWVAMTLIFFLPKLVPGRDPVMERMTMLLATGGIQAEGIERMVQAYRSEFGLDQPLYVQYLRYLSHMIRFDFNYSLAQYPTKVIDLIALALPWTIGLLSVSTLLAFSLGSLAGGLLAWPKTPKIFAYLLSPFLLMSSIPFFLLGLMLIYIFAFKLKILPLGGGSQFGQLPALTPAYLLDIVTHSILPASAIVIASLGGWALGMRGMMITTLGEDYIILAQARGLAPRRIFFAYAMRNAMLPQITSLALSVGTIVSGSLLVEAIFRYPGIGSVLFTAISGFDYFTIYGVVFFVILAIALATLFIDLLYPLLDPRIRYQKN
ncbi:MAG: ABC transporter permease [Chloroflexi bacterium]|nr:MAG: ABC transporter permease [Chloroflexota bacterium]